MTRMQKQKRTLDKKLYAYSAAAAGMALMATPDGAHAEINYFEGPWTTSVTDSNIISFNLAGDVLTDGTHVADEQFYLNYSMSAAGGKSGSKIPGLPGKGGTSTIEDLRIYPGVGLTSDFTVTSYGPGSGTGTSGGKTGNTKSILGKYGKGSTSPLPQSVLNQIKSGQITSLDQLPQSIQDQLQGGQTPQIGQTIPSPAYLGLSPNFLEAGDEVGQDANTPLPLPPQGVSLFSVMNNNTNKTSKMVGIDPAKLSNISDDDLQKYIGLMFDGTEYNAYYGWAEIALQTDMSLSIIIGEKTWNFTPAEWEALQALAGDLAAFQALYPELYEAMMSGVSPQYDQNIDLKMSLLRYAYEDVPFTSIIVGDTGSGSDSEPVPEPTTFALFAAGAAGLAAVRRRQKKHSGRA